jgi:hypothetical protein
VIVFLQHAFSEWWRRRKSEKKESILDYAEKKYGKAFIEDVKALKSVTYMFLPFPIFWALFDQQVCCFFEVQGVPGIVTFVANL